MSAAQERKTMARLAVAAGSAATLAAAWVGVIQVEGAPPVDTSSDTAQINAPAFAAQSVAPVSQPPGAPGTSTPAPAAAVAPANAGVATPAAAAAPGTAPVTTPAAAPVTAPVIAPVAVPVATATVVAAPAATPMPRVVVRRSRAS